MCHRHHADGHPHGVSGSLPVNVRIRFADIDRDHNGQAERLGDRDGCRWPRPEQWSRHYADREPRTNSEPCADTTRYPDTTPYADAPPAGRDSADRSGSHANESRWIRPSWRPGHALSDSRRSPADRRRGSGAPG